MLLSDREIWLIPQPIRPYVPAAARFLIVVTFLEGELARPHLVKPLTERQNSELTRQTHSES